MSGYTLIFAIAKHTRYLPLSQGGGNLLGLKTKHSSQFVEYPPQAGGLIPDTHTVGVVGRSEACAKIAWDRHRYRSRSPSRMG
jgi:hypothetical protein